MSETIARNKLLSRFSLPPNVAPSVSLLLEEEPKNPKCFAEALTDFTCFWEEDEERAGSVAQYSFTYNYQ